MFMPPELKAAGFKLVYELSEQLKADPERVAAAQALTLNPDKPYIGLKGTSGLYGSDVWWENIRRGKIKTEQISGVITSLFFAGQDARWGDEVNSFALECVDGRLIKESIYAHKKADRKLFQVDAKVWVAYVMDELKMQPARDGCVNYSKTVLEMAVL